MARSGFTQTLLLLIWCVSMMPAPMAAGAEGTATWNIKQFVASKTSKPSVAYDGDAGLLIAQLADRTMTFLIKPNGSLCYDQGSASFVRAATVLRDADGRIFSDFFRILPSDISVKNIIALLGDPHRDVGSGTAILQWDFTDGSKVDVNMTLLEHRVGAPGNLSNDTICTRIMANGSRQSVYAARAP